MRLLLFTPQFSSGGAQQVAVLLSSGLVSLGHEVHIAAATLEGELLSRINPKCQLADLGARKSIQARQQLAKLVNRITPDAMICFGIYTGIAAAFSRLSWKHQPVFLIRNENNLHTDWQQGTVLNQIIGPPLSRWAAHRAHVIAVSHSLALPTANFLRIPTAQITTITNPVIDDTMLAERTSDTPLHPWLKDKERPTFVAMGRLEHQKGFDILINAFARVQQQSRARLVIFGQGSLREQLQAQINAGDLGKSIVLAGHTNHPITQMQAAHAFVLSSRFEGFGLVLVEALLAGTHVISTDCDYGPAEVLENGRYGTLVPLDDVGALGDAMLASLSTMDSKPHPAESWFAQFAATEAARQHIAVIESIIAHRNSTAG